MTTADRTIRRKVLWIALTVCLLTHAAYLVMDHDYYGDDTPSYLIPAQNLLHGYGFVNALHHPEVRRTPGYPLLLALFQIPPLKLNHLIFVQHALCVVLAVALAYVALLLTNKPAVALVAAVFFSLDLATIRIANLLLTEVAAATLIALTAWALYRAISSSRGIWYAAMAGLLGGCAALVRPVAILYVVPLAFCIVFALRRRALRTLTIFAVSFLLLPGLWIVRNRLEAGYSGLSSISSEDILFYRAAGALAIQQHGNYSFNVEKTRGFLVNQACLELKQTTGRNCMDLTDSQRASYYAAKGASIIAHAPVSYLQSVLLGLVYTILGGGAEALSKITNLNPRTAECVILFFTIPEACLALIGCWYWYKKNRNICCLLVLTVAYFLVISAGAEAYSRFRVPVMPMYALLAGGGAAEVLQILRRSKPSHTIAANPAAGTQ